MHELNLTFREVDNRKYGRRRILLVCSLLLSPLPKAPTALRRVRDIFRPSAVDTNSSVVWPNTTKIALGNHVLLHGRWSRHSHRNGLHASSVFPEIDGDGRGRTTAKNKPKPVATRLRTPGNTRTVKNRIDFRCPNPTRYYYDIFETTCTPLHILYVIYILYVLNTHNNNNNNNM